MKPIGKSNYADLDRSEILMRLFHPRPETRFGSPEGGEDLLIPVGDGHVAGARYHSCDAEAPTMLFFHGNGEIVADYDDLAPLFVRAGVNFLPVDYRGYGRSSGSPTVTAVMQDCHAVLQFVNRWLGERGNHGSVVVAGRSLGSAPAIELAASYGQPSVAGLVVESGFARALPLLQTLGIDTKALGIREDRAFRNVDKIQAYSGPTVLIHGEKDRLIPVTNAHELFDACRSREKKLVVLPEADHNTVFLHGIRDYLTAVSDLATKVRQC